METYSQETYTWFFHDDQIKVQYNWQQVEDSIKYQFEILNNSAIDVYVPILGTMNELKKMFSLDSSVLKLGNGITFGLLKFGDEVELKKISSGSVYRLNNSFWYSFDRLPDLHVILDFLISEGKNKPTLTTEDEILYETAKYSEQCERIHFLREGAKPMIIQK